MNIVVLDGHTLNPGDLDDSRLHALGSCTIYDRTPPDLVLERAAEAEVVLTNKTALSRETIALLPRLRYIGVLATGYNVVDAQAAGERGIPVTNVPTYGTESVAQMVFAHLLNLTQHVAEHAQGTARGRWTNSPDFCYWDSPLVELQGLTLGLVGFGRIGRATARLGLAFGMRVVACDVIETECVPGVEFADLASVFRASDVVSLHCPLTPESEGLVNRERLAQMKSTAFLINTSRGPLVDEKALVEALSSGGIAGVGLDVLCQEPPVANNPLLRARNCYVTPHISWASRAARERLLGTATENIEAFLDGASQNVVNGV